MSKIELTILKEDILNSDYYISSDCAITRALKRAGIAAEEEGLNIKGKDIDIPLFKYQDLSDKVISMYQYLGTLKGSHLIPIEPEDFTYILEY